MQIHTSAKIEHDVGLVSFVEAGSRLIVDEYGRDDELGVSWELDERGLLAVWVVDRSELEPPVKLQGVACNDLAGLQHKIRSHRTKPASAARSL